MYFRLLVMIRSRTTANCYRRNIGEERSWLEWLNNRTNFQAAIVSVARLGISLRIENEHDTPKHLAREVHRQYFHPEISEFASRTKWSWQNAFTGALKALEPILCTGRPPAPASLGESFDKTRPN